MTDMTHKSYRLSWHVARWRTAVSLGVVITALSSYALALPAFPGVEGFGAETTHGRNGTVVFVTNTNDSGSGSLREALMMTEPRIIIFRVSGTIDLQSKISLGAAQSYVAVFGQTAPGDGIALKGPDNSHILQLSAFGGADTPGAFHDGLFQHLRFRHGSPILANSPNTDNLTIAPGTYNVVFDHNSFTWAGDEVISIWGGNVHDITFSHNLFAEGVVFCREGNQGSLGQNVGPLLSGGTPQYNNTFHHNVLMHMCFRNYKLDAGAGGGTKGTQIINNVHYNNSAQEYGFAQNLYTGSTANTADVISDYFKNGPDGPARPFILTVETAGSYAPMSLYFVNSTWRNQDGSPAPGNDETNNYSSSMMGFQTYIAMPTFTIRDTPISPQPTYPVTTTSATQAYTDLIINKDVGATKPALDSVDTRLLNDPEDGAGWSAANIPSPRGSASYPTLSTYDVPIDTDSDGVPDADETSMFGSNPLLADSGQDHDGDGYTNIEEYIHSLSEAGPTVGAESKPNPPTNVTVN